MNEDETRRLTNRIKEVTDELLALLQEASEGDAWKALGQTTWKKD